MRRGMLLTLAVALVAGSTVSAQPKKPTTMPVGTWVKGFGDDSVTFEIKKTRLRVILRVGQDTITVDADSGFSSKDSVVFGRITKTNDLSGNAPPPGSLFSVGVQRKNGTLVISDLLPGSPEARDVIEGTYKLKKEK